MSFFNPFRAARTPCYEPWLTNAEMDIDAGVTKALSGQSSKSKKGKGRVEKKRAKKERNNIAFKKTKPFKRRDKIGRA